VYRDLLQGFSG